MQDLYNGPGDLLNDPSRGYPYLAGMPEEVLVTWYVRVSSIILILRVPS